jgi:tRNA(adenine34) deaminase
VVVANRRRSSLRNAKATMRVVATRAATRSTSSEDDDRRWMEQALLEAHAAATRGEIPVGAVLVRDGTLLARAGNLSVAAHDPSGHAEVRVLRAAAAAVENYRLPGTTLYVTVEPCLMCMGTALHARVTRVVYGCADPKGGAAGSLYDLATDARLNHRIAVVRGVAEDSCRALLKEFFRARRSASP